MSTIGSNTPKIPAKSDNTDVNSYDQYESKFSITKASPNSLTLTAVSNFLDKSGIIPNANQTTDINNRQSNSIDSEQAETLAQEAIDFAISDTDGSFDMGTLLATMNYISASLDDKGISAFLGKIAENLKELNSQLDEGNQINLEDIANYLSDTSGVVYGDLKSNLTADKVYGTDNRHNYVTLFSDNPINLNDKGSLDGNQYDNDEGSITKASPNSLTLTAVSNFLDKSGIIQKDKQTTDINNRQSNSIKPEQAEILAQEAIDFAISDTDGSFDMEALLTAMNYISASLDKEGISAFLGKIAETLKELNSQLDKGKQINLEDIANYLSDTSGVVYGDLKSNLTAKNVYGFGKEITAFNKFEQNNNFDELIKNLGIEIKDNAKDNNVSKPDIAKFVNGMLDYVVEQKGDTQDLLSIMDQFAGKLYNGTEDTCGEVIKNFVGMVGQAIKTKGLENTFATDEIVEHIFGERGESNNYAKWIKDKDVRRKSRDNLKVEACDAFKAGLDGSQKYSDLDTSLSSESSSGSSYASLFSDKKIEQKEEKLEDRISSTKLSASTKPTDDVSKFVKDNPLGAYDNSVGMQEGIKRYIADKKLFSDNTPLEHQHDIDRLAAAIIDQIANNPGDAEPSVLMARYLDMCEVPQVIPQINKKHKGNVIHDQYYPKEQFLKDLSEKLGEYASKNEKLKGIFGDTDNPLKNVEDADNDFASHEEEQSFEIFKTAFYNPEKNTNFSDFKRMKDYDGHRDRHIDEFISENGLFQGSTESNMQDVEKLVVGIMDQCMREHDAKNRKELLGLYAQQVVIFIEEKFGERSAVFEEVYKQFGRYASAYFEKDESVKEEIFNKFRGTTGKSKRDFSDDQRNIFNAGWDNPNLEIDTGKNTENSTLKIEKVNIAQEEAIAEYLNTSGIIPTEQQTVDINKKRRNSLTSEVLDKVTDAVIDASKKDNNLDITTLITNMNYVCSNLDTDSITLFAVHIGKKLHEAGVSEDQKAELIKYFISSEDDPKSANGFGQLTDSLNVDNVYGNNAFQMIAFIANPVIDSQSIDLIKEELNKKNETIKNALNNNTASDVFQTLKIDSKDAKGNLQTGVSSETLREYILEKFIQSNTDLTPEQIEGMRTALLNTIPFTSELLPQGDVEAILKSVEYLYFFDEDIWTDVKVETKITLSDGTDFSDYTRMPEYDDNRIGHINTFISDNQLFNDPTKHDTDLEKLVIGIIEQCGTSDIKNPSELLGNYIKEVIPILEAKGIDKGKIYETFGKYAGAYNQNTDPAYFESVLDIAEGNNNRTNDTIIRESFEKGLANSTDLLIGSKGGKVEYWGNSGIFEPTGIDYEDKETPWQRRKRRFFKVLSNPIFQGVSWAIMAASIVVAGPALIAGFSAMVRGAFQATGTIMSTAAKEGVLGVVKATGDAVVKTLQATGKAVVNTGVAAVETTKAIATAGGQAIKGATSAAVNGMATGKGLLYGAAFGVDMVYLGGGAYKYKNEDDRSFGTIADMFGGGLSLLGMGADVASNIRRAGTAGKGASNAGGELSAAAPTPRQSLVSTKVNESNGTKLEPAKSDNGDNSVEQKNNADDAALKDNGSVDAVEHTNPEIWITNSVDAPTIDMQATKKDTLEPKAPPPSAPPPIALRDQSHQSVWDTFLDLQRNDITVENADNLTLTDWIEKNRLSTEEITTIISKNDKDLNRALIEHRSQELTNEHINDMLQITDDDITKELINNDNIKLGYDQILSITYQKNKGINTLLIEKRLEGLKPDHIDDMIEASDVETIKKLINNNDIYLNESQINKIIEEPSNDVLIDLVKSERPLSKGQKDYLKDVARSDNKLQEELISKGLAKENDFRQTASIWSTGRARIGELFGGFRKPRVDGDVAEGGGFPTQPKTVPDNETLSTDNWFTEMGYDTATAKNRILNADNTDLKGIINDHNIILDEYDLQKIISKGDTDVINTLVDSIYIKDLDPIHWDAINRKLNTEFTDASVNTRKAYLEYKHDLEKQTSMNKIFKETIDPQEKLDLLNGLKDIDKNVKIKQSALDAAKEKRNEIYAVKAKAEQLQTHGRISKSIDNLLNTLDNKGFVSKAQLNAWVSIQKKYLTELKLPEHLSQFGTTLLKNLQGYAAFGGNALKTGVRQFSEFTTNLRKQPNEDTISVSQTPQESSIQVEKGIENNAKLLNKKIEDIISKNNNSKEINELLIGGEKLTPSQIDAFITKFETPEVRTFGLYKDNILEELDYYFHTEISNLITHRGDELTPEHINRLLAINDKKHTLDLINNPKVKLEKEHFDNLINNGDSDILSDLFISRFNELQTTQKNTFLNTFSNKIHNILLEKMDKNHKPVYLINYIEKITSTDTVLLSNLQNLIAKKGDFENVKLSSEQIDTLIDKIPHSNMFINKNMNMELLSQLVKKRGNELNPQHINKLIESGNNDILKALQNIGIDTTQRIDNNRVAESFKNTFDIKIDGNKKISDYMDSNEKQLFDKALEKINKNSPLDDTEKTLIAAYLKDPVIAEQLQKDLGFSNVQDLYAHFKKKLQISDDIFKNSLTDAQNNIQDMKSTIENMVKGREIPENLEITNLNNFFKPEKGDRGTQNLNLNQFLQSFYQEADNAKKEPLNALLHQENITQLAHNLSNIIFYKTYPAGLTKGTF